MSPKNKKCYSRQANQTCLWHKRSWLFPPAIWPGSILSEWPSLSQTSKVCVPEKVAQQKSQSWVECLCDFTRVACCSLGGPCRVVVVILTTQAKSWYPVKTSALASDRWGESFFFSPPSGCSWAAFLVVCGMSAKEGVLFLFFWKAEKWRNHVIVKYDII